MSSTTIPKGSIVLVTGVNGYLGMHVANQVLLDGYKVRGTVRDSEKARWTQEHFDKTYGKGNFEVSIVKDLAAEGAFDEIIKGCSGVIHVASDVTFGPDPNKVITPIVNGMEFLLHAASNQSSIKSFVYTSSSSALSLTRLNERYTLNKDLWNETSVKAAWAPPPYSADRAADVYAASKTQAEQKAWELLKNHEITGFKFNSINPNFLLGSILHQKQNKSTGGMPLGMLHNSPQAIEFLSAIGPQWVVNVEDVAKLHVIALIDPAVSGERLLAYAEKFDYNKLIETMSKLVGDDAMKNIEREEESGGKDLSEVDVARSEELLRGVGLQGLKGLEQSLKECLDSAAALQ
ncbi:related to aldehyde reductase II [Rhynchosporium agropyri]|uniref:Related to aldehyde reductase II n=1 Tax=Rhynchosporium agropyri TaxID=914238 RepID=A0A1E1JXQ7_9HELO|nr:related to aldehyde reductase II [Rhynchosporium agropyri]